MKKIKSIKQNSKFVRLYKKEKALISPCFVCYARRIKRDEVYLGLTVSKKIGGAVERNRAKRVLRVAAQEAVKSGLCSCELLLVARGKTPFVKSDRVCSELVSLLKKEGFIKESAQ